MRIIEFVALVSLLASPLGACGTPQSGVMPASLAVVPRSYYHIARPVLPREPPRVAKDAPGDPVLARLDAIEAQVRALQQSLPK